MKITSRFVTLSLGWCLGCGLLASSLVISAQAKPKATVKTKSKPLAKKPLANSIRWSNNFAASLAQARRTKKPMFIDFSTEWCTGCKVLEKTTYRDPKFIAASRGWVMVMLNPEKSALNAKLQQQYRVTAYPTMIFADSEGKIISQVEGSYPTNMLLPRMEAALQQLKTERLAASR